MATSSILKNFVISGKEQVTMFLDAIEASEKDRPERIPVLAERVTDSKEVEELLEKWEKFNAGGSKV